MDLFVLLFQIAIIGVIAWAIVTYLPMPPVFKSIIVVVAVIVVLIILWSVFGGYAPHIHVGK